MATPKTITIDASNAAGGVNLDTYFATYFQGLKIGSSSYYGGIEDPAPYGYQNGTQVGFRYADAANAATNKQVLIEGEDLAYDFAHYGRIRAMGSRAPSNPITFGTATTRSACRAGRIDGHHGQDLTISGLGHHRSEPGAGNNVRSNPDLQSLQCPAPERDWEQGRGLIATINETIRQPTPRTSSAPASTTPLAAGTNDDTDRWRRRATT